MAKNKLFGLISAVLFLLVGIFSFLKIFTAKISILGMSQSYGGSLLEMKEATPLATIAVILLALVAVCGLVCALLGKYKFAMIAAAVELVLSAIVNALLLIAGLFREDLAKTLLDGDPILAMLYNMIPVYPEKAEPLLYVLVPPICGIIANCLFAGLLSQSKKRVREAALSQMKY